MIVEKNINEIYRNTQKTGTIDYLWKSEKITGNHWKLQEISLFPLIDSYILHKQKSRQNIQLSDFRLQLIRQIIETYGYSKAPRGRPSAGDNPIRFIGRHFPSLIPSSLTMQSLQRRCIFCSNTTNRVTKSTKIRYDLKSRTIL
jgi:hypothetical protein